MKQRFVTEQLERIIRRVPAVALLGPRQIGKTTLAKAIGRTMPSLYLDLESLEDQRRLHDPVAFFANHADKLIILDEIQRAPEIFAALRGVIDTRRQQGRKGAQFLLLGSASMDLMRQSSESLAGRIHYVSMSGFHALEVKDTPKELQKLWLRGGFPESYLSKTDTESAEWREMLIRSYLERDLPQLGFRVPAVRLRRLWTMLAHLQGETINHSKLAGNLEVDAKTVGHYIDILADLLLVRRLEPWHANVKKRLVKSPRVYVRDSGLLHRLLNVGTRDDLLSHPVLGKSWEGFVMENIFSVLPETASRYYYRTSDAHEVDLVLEFSARERWAIEIKHGLAPKLSAGFHQACDDINATKKWVVYSGNDSFPIGNNTQMISLRGMMEKITSHAPTA